MDKLFDRLSRIGTVEELSGCISEGISELYELYSSEMPVIRAERDAINNFVLFKSSTISKLDFEIQEHRAFLMICLDLAVRLNLQSAIPLLVRTVNRHKEQIHLGKRLSAGISFIVPRPHTAEDIINLYANICSQLQEAIDTEEDNDRKSIITFLSYYYTAIDLLSADYALKLKDLISTSIQASEYAFLNDIQGLSSVKVTDSDTAKSQIQSIIDYYIQEASTCRKPIPVDEFIIEEGTQYSRDIQTVNCSFQSIKSLSDRQASWEHISGRGVEQIQTEKGLFDYMGNYGNMHRAKIESALVPPFPQCFDSPVTLIDWGCGQGLASMVFMEKYGTGNIKQIILIEPSELALRRAALHCKKFAQNVPLQTICKEFDELTVNDIHIVQAETTVHLFSNVLDMECYSVEHLVNILKSLPHREQYCVCISPFIDDIRTEKIATFVNQMQCGNSSFRLLNSIINTKRNEFWKCNNMEMGHTKVHGGNAYCGSYSGAPCMKRWTRVLKVFQA